MNIFKRLKLVDYIIIAVIIILVAIGTLAVFKKKNFSNLPIEKESTIHFEVFFRGVTVSDIQSPFKEGDSAFITIRNVPYTKLKIVATDFRPRMKVLSANNKQVSKIKIENSVVNATGGQAGAGIGAGYDTHCQANNTNAINDIIIVKSTINAKGGKYAAGIGTGFHSAALTGSIDASTINALPGEDRYKDTYTIAQSIGYGVIDPTREGFNLNVTFKVNGEVITNPIQ